ncbi:MAG: efflux RND transporter periplasmic adaptor subunit [Myxococcaceae bacterium]|nr:efflux RND transporter periplasmic adaptor subunit [Myxococcaceae bacterium]MCI0670686.1 efflux RND transporter periplasmic adaptor subunit [Myxococcaceae bacterium]
MNLERPLIAATLATCGLLLSGCEARATQQAATAAANAPASSPTVRIATPKPVQSVRSEEATGTLYPAKALQLGFEVGGRLERVRAQKGERVKQGQVIAQLNAEIADAQVKQATATVAAAEAGAELATDVAGRNAKLQELGSVSDMASRSAASTSQQARSQLLAARAGLSQAQAARRRHDLRAPFDGTIIDAPDQVGATVGPGVTLFKLEQLDTLILRTSVSSSARAQLVPGTRVRVEVVGDGAATDEATVTLVLPSADAQTRRIPVEIRVSNADGRFVANTLARATLKLGSATAAQALPASALASSGGDHVLVVDAAGKVRRVAVDVLERNAREVVVRAPALLERVIDSPTSGLTEGTRVSIQ